MTTNQFWIPTRIVDFLLELEPGSRLSVPCRPDTEEHYATTTWLTIVNTRHTTPHLREVAKSRGLVVRDDQGTFWIMMYSDPGLPVWTATPWNGWDGVRDGQACFHEASVTVVTEFFPLLPD